MMSEVASDISMQGRKSLSFVSVIVAALMVCGCKDDRREFEVKGVIKDLKPNGKTAVIKHEAIPDYMGAMTMDFDVKDPRELAGLHTGDAVSFRLVVTTDDGWIENVHKLPPAAPTNASQRITISSTNGADAGPVSFRRSPIVEPLNIGDAIPDYKFTNEFGSPVSLAQFKGKALGLTFFFTRCPFPLFCPRMSQNFEKAQKAMKALPGVPQNWALLSISFDPEYDTPDRLKKYSVPYNVDTNHWQFATSDLWNLDGITDQFGLSFYRETANGLPQHNLRTVVVDARGRVQKVFVGNEWNVDEFVNEMVKAAAVN